jgi:hypothetical protein
MGLNIKFITLLVLGTFVATSLAWNIGNSGYIKAFQDHVASLNSSEPYKRFMPSRPQKRAILDKSDFRSKARLNALGHASSIPAAKFFANPMLEDAVNNGVFGVWDASINGDIAVTSFEGFGAAPGTFPGMASFTGALNGSLVLKDVIYLNFTEGAAASSVCKNPAKRLVSQALISPKTPFTNPFTNPVNIIMVVYEYDAQGVFNRTPRVWQNLKAYEPLLFEGAASYSGAVRFDDECEHLIWTASIVASPALFGLPDQQSLGLVTINNDWSLSNPVRTLYPSTGIPTYLWFSQTINMKKNAQTGKTILIAPSDTYSFIYGDIQGLHGTAGLFSYVYDPVALTLTQKSLVPQPSYIQGMAVANKGDVVVTFLDCVVSGQTSFSTLCHTAYNNLSPNPNDEIRSHNINPDGTLTYTDSHDIDGWAMNGAFSPDDDVLIATTSATLINAYINNSTLSFAPSAITTYEWKKNKYEVSDVKHASALCFGIYVHPDGRVIVGCQPKLLQEDTQVFYLSSS